MSSIIWFQALAYGAAVAGAGLALGLITACITAWCCADWQAEEFQDGEHEANDGGRVDG